MRVELDDLRVARVLEYIGIWHRTCEPDRWNCNYSKPRFFPIRSLWEQRFWSAIFSQATPPCQIPIETATSIAPKMDLARDCRVSWYSMAGGPHHFPESFFSRTSFSRIVVQSNVIFTNRRSGERCFPETSFARTSFCRNWMKQNGISPNTK